MNISGIDYARDSEEYSLFSNVMCPLLVSTLRLIHMCPPTKSDRSESGPLLLTIIFMTVFIRRAPVEDNTASERIGTVAATYGCKILQPYEYDANVYGYDVI